MKSRPVPEKEKESFMKTAQKMGKDLVVLLKR